MEKFSPELTKSEVAEETKKHVSRLVKKLLNIVQEKNINLGFEHTEFATGQFIYREYVKRRMENPSLEMDEFLADLELEIPNMAKTQSESDMAAFWSQFKKGEVTYQEDETKTQDDFGGENFLSKYGFQDLDPTTHSNRLKNTDDDSVN